MITTTEFSQIGPRFFLASCPHSLENLEKGSFLQIWLESCTTAAIKSWIFKNFEIFFLFDCKK